MAHGGGCALSISNANDKEQNNNRANQNVTHESPRRFKASPGGANVPRLFVHTTFPAPYRVALFDRLKSRYEVLVAYEDARDTAHERDEAWYSEHLGSNAFIARSSEGSRAYKTALRELRSFDAVLVYEYSSTRAMRLMLRCLRMKVPYLINADGAFINKNPLKTAVKRFFISRASACLAGSESAEAYFLQYGAKPLRIFRHKFTNLEDADVRKSVPTALERATLREELSLPSDGVIFLAIGQFIHRKGFDLLLESWRDLSSGGATLVIMGGGPEESRYREIIEKSRLENVLVNGFGPRESVFRHYLASDCFVLPTREDVWGLVVNEAMACGLPVITTDHCVAGRELIDQRINGFVVEVGDTEALRRAMEEIAADPEMRFAMGSSNIAKMSSHTIASAACSHAEAIERVLTSERNGPAR